MLSSSADQIKLALCLWTSPGAWPTEVADLRNELCLNQSDSFSNPQLSEESMSIVKTFRALNLGDIDRPVKRRKTLPDPTEDEDVNSSVYAQLQMALNGSSLESPVLGLSDLHNTVQ